MGGAVVDGLVVDGVGVVGVGWPVGLPVEERVGGDGGGDGDVPLQPASMPTLSASHPATTTVTLDRPGLARQRLTRVTLRPHRR